MTMFQSMCIHRSPRHFPQIRESTTFPISLTINSIFTVSSNKIIFANHFVLENDANGRKQIIFIVPI